MDSFEQAKLLLNLEPIPPDINARLDALRKDVPESGLDAFDMLYEAACAAMPYPPDQKPRGL